MLAFGYVGDGEPGRPAFRTAFASAAGREALRGKVVLLHCTSDYPAPDDEINLRAIDTLAEPLRPAGRLVRPQRGHFCSDRRGGARRGDDREASHARPHHGRAGPRGLDRAVGIQGHGCGHPPGRARARRRAQGADARPRKRPCRSRARAWWRARRSAAAKRSIADNLAVKRPGTGHVAGAVLGHRRLPRHAQL